MPTSPLAFGSPPGYALSSWALGQGFPAAVDPQERSTDDTSGLIWHKIAEEEMWTEKRQDPTNEPWALELAEVDRGTAKKKKVFSSEVRTVLELLGWCKRDCCFCNYF